MSSQQQRMLNSPAELVHHMMQQLQMELELANQSGKDTPEGQSHLFRARQLKMQLINVQHQMQQRRQSQQQQSQQSQQSSQHNSPQAAHQQLAPAGSSQSMDQQFTSQQQHNQQQVHQSPAQQSQQLRMAQMAQTAQLNQLRQQQSQHTSPQPSPQPMNAQLQTQTQSQAQQPSGQPGAGQQGQQRTAINMNTANGFQQRFAQVEELRRHHSQLTTRIEQVEAALRTRTNPAEVEKIQQQLQYMQNRRELVRQRELLLMRELRQAIDRRNQPQQAQNQSQLQNQQKTNPVKPELQQQPQQSPQLQQQPQQPQRQVPAGQQAAAQLQSQMLRGVPRNQQGQPVAQNQVNAARAAQIRALQQQQQQQQQVPAQTPSQPQAQSQAQAQTQKRPAAPVGATPGMAPVPGQANVPNVAGPQGMGTLGAVNPAAPHSLDSTTAASAAALPQNAVVSTPTRAMAQSMPIPAHLNVASPQPVNMRSGRPSLTNGGATDAQALNSPALVRAPPMDLSGDRLLSKRKLSDLIGSIMGEDNEPLIDADVEELLLDLADEFVTSVTSFACKLAKHRKSDVLEAKDIHMHLERNWNMHIAGYSSDDIRSIRRFMPTQTYQQKLQGIGMAKSVNK